MSKENTNLKKTKVISDTAPLTVLPLKNDAQVILEKYAIIQTGGKQYFALENKTIMIEKLDGEVNDEVIFTEVLFKRINAEVCSVGKPFLAEPIKGTIIKHIRGDKIVVFKFKRRKKYRKKQGHRQSYTIVRIQEIK